MQISETSFWIYGLGFFGQALFGARLLVQLFLSEKEGRVVSPTIFWVLSLAASLIFLIYGILRNDIVIIAGQTLSYFIYIRNLQLKNSWDSIHILSRLILFLLPFVAILSSLVQTKAIADFALGQALLHPVMILGAFGQLMLNLRFVYQWWYSEKHKTSLLPIGFWHISTWASVLVLIYAVFHPLYGWDPVLLVAQGFGIIVYVRNIFIFRSSVKRNLVKTT